MRSQCEKSPPLLWVMALAMFLSGNAFGLLFGGEGSEKTIFTFVRMFLALGPLLLIVSHLRKTMSDLFHYIPLILILSYLSIISFLAAQPYFAVKGVFEIALSLLFGIAMAASYRPDQTAKAIVLSFILAVTISIVWIVLVPEAGIQHGDEFEGQWRGVYIHKNTFGQTTSFCAALLISNGHRIFKSRAIVFIGIAIALACSVLAGSVSGYSIILFAIAQSFFRRLVAGLPAITTAVIVIVGAAFLVLVVPMIYEEILYLFGRDPTLSNRTNVWRATVDYMSSRNWITGLGLNYASGEDFRDYMTNIFHAGLDPHSGYLRMVMEIGISGLIAMMALVFFTLYRFHRLKIHSPRDRAGLEVLELVVWCWLVSMLVEAGPFAAGSLLFIAAMSAICVLLTYQAAPAGPASRVVKRSVAVAGRRVMPIRSPHVLTERLLHDAEVVPASREPLN